MSGKVPSSEERGQEQSIDELLNIVGEERASHSGEEIATAEEAIRTLALRERKVHIRRMHRWGLVVAATGFYLALVGSIYLVLLCKDPERVRTVSEEIPIWVTVPCIIASSAGSLTGVVLCVGGLAFYYRSEWGRQAIVAGLRASAILSTLIAGFLVVFMLAVVRLEAFNWVASALAVAAAAALVLYLKSETRRFKSDDAKRWCGGAGIPE